MPPSQLSVPDDLTITSNGLDMLELKGAAPSKLTVPDDLIITSSGGLDTLALRGAAPSELSVPDDLVITSNGGSDTLALRGAAPSELSVPDDLLITSNGGSGTLALRGAAPSELSVPDDLTLTSNGVDMLTLKGTATPAAAILHAPTGPITDGDLSPNTLSPSIDETNHFLRVRAEYSNTTLKTALIPFQVSSPLTVGATGADFTTIQAAWNFLKGRTFTTGITIAVQSGTYNESLSLSQQPLSAFVTIQGDTRSAAGQHFPTTGSITKTGSNCTITLTATPPSDFTNADHVVIGGTATAANVGRFPIVSIDTVNKTVTYVNASGVAEAVRANTEVIFCPDRILNFSGFSNGVVCSCFEAPVFSGFTLISSSTGAAGVTAAEGSITVTKCVAYNIQDIGFQARVGGTLKTDAKCAAVKCVRGFFTTLNGTMTAAGTYSSDHADGYIGTFGGVMLLSSAVVTNCGNGFIADGATLLPSPSAVASHNTVGFHAANCGYLNGNGGTARNNGTGYIAQFNALVSADSTSANNSGNTTNYNPATSGTPSATNGLIRWT